MKSRSNTLQHSLFINFSLIICLIMIVCFAIFYAIFSLYSGKMVTSGQINLCSSISDSLDSEIKQMNTVSMNIIYSNLITKNFKSYLASPEKGLPASAKATTAETIFDVIWAIIGPFQTVSQVNIYSFDGKMIGSGLFNMEAEVRVEDKSWYEETMALGGSKHIGKPELMPFLDVKNYIMKGHKFFSLTRFFSSDRFIIQGIVEVLQDQTTVFSHIDLAERLNKNVSIFVLSENGDLLYPDTAETGIMGPYYKDLLQRRVLLPMKVIPLKDPHLNDNRVTTCFHSDYTNWDIIVSEPTRTIYEPVRRVVLYLALSSAILIFLGWIASFATASRLSVPLKNLQHALSAIDAGDLADPDFIPPMIESHPIREIEALNHSFKVMRSSLRQSTGNLLLARSEETKAKMLALQSLMNPHFIFNNLASISAMAETGHTGEIVAVCQDISFILRYISSDGEGGVPLSLEIEHTERYLKCMAVRFGSDLSYTVDIPDAMQLIVIPKLIVQPIVENSVKHGFQVSPPWRVRVSGTIDGGQWRLFVEDNGIGFNPASLALLRERIRESTVDGVVLPYGIERIGLLNINLRMRILYGDSFVFAVDEAPGGGTLVTIGGAVNGPESV